MMKNTKNYSLQTACYVVLFFLLYLLSTTELLPLKIGNASPLPLIPAVTMIAFVFGVWPGFWAGILCGIALDAVLAPASCFNTLTLLIIGGVAGYVTDRYLNKNIYTLAVLSVLSAAAYFSAKWFVLYFLASSADALEYLLFYALPSGIYSAVFILPIYGIHLLISKINYK